MKTTIQDVARKANVSKATVSRVLNQNPQVKKEIREKVLKAIEELDFRPSALARNLANSRSNTIALVVPDMTNPYFPVLARGVEDEAHKKGYMLFISNTDNNPDLEKQYLDKLIEQQVCGIVLVSALDEEELLARWEKYHVPVVLCERHIDNSPFDIVLIDDYKASYDTITAFIQHGHKNIVHITGPMWVDSAKFRKKAYEQAMDEAGLDALIKIGEFTFESGKLLMREILDSGSRPTALFAANDLIAIGAMSAIYEYGLSVPEDIAIIGCDNTLISAMSRPTLSTIAVPAYDIGVRAVELLDERVKGVQREPITAIMEHQFIWRESSGGQLV